jgi:hypothetical protein
MVAIQMSPEQNDQVAEWRAKGRYTFPVLLVPPVKSGTPQSQDYSGGHFGVWLAPTDLLLNGAHKVVFRHVGATGAALEVEIREMLGLPAFDGVQ